MYIYRYMYIYVYIYVIYIYIYICTKCGRETIRRPFFKKSKLSISLDH